MMHTKARSWLKHIDFMVLDLVILALSFIIAFKIKFGHLFWIYDANWKSLFALMMFADIILMLFLNPFSGILRRGYWADIASSLKLAFWNFLIACVVFYLFKIGEDYSREMLIVTYILYLGLSLICKALCKKWLLRHKRSTDDSDRRRLVLVTTEQNASKAEKLATADDVGAIKVAGFCLVDPHSNDGGFSRGAPEIINGKPAFSLKQLTDFCEEHRVDEVVFLVAPAQFNPALFKSLIRRGIRVSFAIDEIMGMTAENKSLGRAGAYNTLELDHYSFGTTQLLYLPIKRLIDISFGAIGCIALVPIVGVIKAAYLITGDTHSIFYEQERIGLRGKSFGLRKIRTMVWNADEVLQELLKQEKYRDEWDKNQKFQNDPRITKIGKFLRKTSLDEFPQFINIIKGDMSLVGPRPLVPGELEAHNGSSLYNKVKPGITGWWGCNGRSNIEYQERLELEYYYVRNCSLYLDALCIFRTFAAIVKRDGAQ